MLARSLLSATALAALATPAQAALVISSGATANVSCTFHVCSATAANAVLNLRDLKAQLATGDTTVSTTYGDLALEGSLTWSDTRRLTLYALDSLHIDRSIEVTGPGQVWLSYRNGTSGSNATLSFGPRGHLHFWDLSSQLTINNSPFATTPYTLVGDIAGLASAVAANPAGHYALAADYDATPDGTYATAPVPTHLTGAFEGLGHTISHLRIVTASHGNYGLFASTDAASSIENLALTDVFIRGTTTMSAGGIVGSAAGLLQNVSVKGTLIGRRNSILGGVVGIGTGSITAAQSSGRITGTAGGFIGGLVGNMTGPIETSHSTAVVVGGVATVAGGLIGGYTGDMRKSWASGAATVGDQYVPRLQPASAGGLVGTIQNGAIIDCYATGAVQAGNASYAGGLLGSVRQSRIQTSYSTGAAVAGAGGITGGFIGFEQQAGTYVNDYWDLTTSGISDPSKGIGNVSSAPGITGLADTQLKSGLPTGFDGTIWALDPAVAGGRPFLLVNPPN
ncbi:MAG TPA: GLUG motif-containing protein [Rhizomicrobium sp.]|nr:GLUG motif-containing protein [Rhizomicrobium sp.]